MHIALRRGWLMLMIGAASVHAARAETQTPNVRNVLFIISDDLKASVLGCYGNRVCKTPNLDQLASEGLVFERAYCQGTACAPSRTSFMFSRYRGQGPVNMGQHLKEHGWYSARVGKIYHMRVPGDIIAGTNGQDVASSWTERFNSQGDEAHSPGEYACLNLNIFTRDLENRQSTRMPHRMFVSVKTDGDGTRQPDYKSASKAIELLDEHGKNPFFLAVGLVRPHYPMVQPPSYFALYPWREMTLPASVENDLADVPKLGWAGTVSRKNPIGQYPDNQKRMWQAYYASVTFMDEQVGRILDHLNQLGLRESTAVIFTSDHGYHLGEHGFWQKSNLHEEVLHVPLIMSVPGSKPARSASIVELMDVFPTVSELVGLEVPASVQGSSLLPILRDPRHDVKPGALAFHNGHSWRTKQWHYMRYKDGTHELYDMARDPNEFHNLAEERSHQSIRERLDQQLTERLKQFGL